MRTLLAMAWVMMAVGGVVQAQSRPDSCKLPAGVMVVPQSLRVGADGRQVFYREILPGGRDVNRPPLRVWRMLDCASGQVGDVADLLPPDVRGQVMGVVDVEVAPGGKVAMVSAVTGKKNMTLYQVDLAGPKAVKVAQGMWVGGVWLGERMLVGRVDDQQVQRLETCRIGGEDRQTLKVRATPAAADAGGRVFLAAGTPADSDRKASIEDTRGVEMLAVSAEGKVLRSFGPLAEFAARPVVSDNGQWAALHRRPREAGEGTIEVTPLSPGTRGGGAVGSAGVPVGVTDEGEVLALDGGEGVSPKWLTLLSGQRQTILPEKVYDAALVGADVWYISAQGQPAVKKISLADLRKLRSSVPSR